MVMRGFSTPGSRALAVAAGLKRPRPSTVPHHPLFCSPAQGNGRWGRDSRRGVAGPYILTCYYSRVASSGLHEGAAQSRCMEIAAAHTHGGSTATLPTHHGVAPPWSQHVLLSPHFLSTLPLFLPSFTTALVVCLAESHTLPSAYGRITYHPRAAAPPPGCRVSTRSSPSQQGTFPTGHFIPA